MKAWNERVIGSGGRLLLLALAGASLAMLAPTPASAQYFGRNKVQYDDFDFKVLRTEHFDIYYYEEEREAIEDLARMSERWYERFARSFQHEFEQRKPLIIYADHPDFQQTNTLRGFIGEGTGGVTESLKNRVIMPMTGSYADTDHVLGHELVHAFQYNIAQSRRGGGLAGLSTLPLWLVEGMAEYLSVGREDAHTAMWLRDALIRDDFPTIRQLTRDQRFFPYRFGQALWAYVAGTYGDDAVTQIYRRALRIGFQPAISQVLGMSTDTLSAQWQRATEQLYVPLMTGRTAPDSVGSVLISEEREGGRQNISPSISPDGRYIAFLSEKDLFSVDLFLADARTGEVLRKLHSANSNPHIDALRYTETSGTWSPDGRYFAFPVFAQGDNELVIVEVESGDIWRRMKPPGIGAITNPAWSPDGRRIAFTGIVGGISDLFVWDIEAEQLTQLTDDRHGDFQADWSPDGTTLAFASDRGPETDFDLLRYSDYQLALIDVDTRQVEVLEGFGNVRHTNPQFAPDGRSLYFVSDQDGFADIYNVSLTGGELRRLTRVSTGVSGITAMSPALSVADQTGEITFSVFSEGFMIHTLPAGDMGSPVTPTTVAQTRGRLLAPAEPERFSRVDEYLGDPETGLPPAGTYSAEDAVPYESSLGLDYVGQQGIGVGADRFGNYVGGGASAFFSDMLGNRILGVMVQAQGTLKDIGGAAQYADLSDRWNWGVSGGRIPYLMMGTRLVPPTETSSPFLGQIRQRVYVSSLSGMVAYPFSQTRRMEFNAGAVRYSYDIEEDRYFLSPGGQIVDHRRIDIDQSCSDAAFNELCKPDPLNLAQVSAAYVGDNSFSGFVGPVRGERFRWELQYTAGTRNYATVIGDWRRYLQPHRNLTVGFRGLHYGRYAGDLQDRGLFQNRRLVSSVSPLFLGYETFIRGYAIESFDSQECLIGQTGAASSRCPTVDRLAGHRLAVANFELRVPLFGVEEFGLINFPYLPTELVLFQDAGLAWTDWSDVDLQLVRSSAARVPVFSTGAAARVNILGFMVLEAYYAYPWQRPEKGAHWGFQIAPAW